MRVLTEAIIGGVVSTLVAIIGAVAAYYRARYEAKKDLRQLERDQNLTVRREARSYMFQRQYELFERLSSSFVEACNAAIFLFPIVESGEPSDLESKKKQRESRYSAAADAHDKAQVALRCAYPFVKSEVYQSGRALLEVLYSHVRVYGRTRVKPLYKADYTDDSDVDSRFYQENHELYPKLDAFLDLLKKDLDVMRLSVTESEAEQNK